MIYTPMTAAPLAVERQLEIEGVGTVFVVPWPEFGIAKHDLFTADGGTWKVLSIESSGELEVGMQVGIVAKPSNGEGDESPAMLTYQVTQEEHELIWKCLAEMGMRWEANVKAWRLDGNESKAAYFEEASKRGMTLLRKVREFDSQFREGTERMNGMSEKLMAMLDKCRRAFSKP